MNNNTESGTDQKRSLPFWKDRTFITSVVCIVSIIASFIFIDAINAVSFYAIMGDTTPAWGFDAWFCALVLSVCSSTFASTRISRYLDTKKI